jgi:hypothetical protein
VLNICGIIEIEFSRICLMIVKEIDLKEWNKQIAINKTWKESLSRKLSPYLLSANDKERE